MRPEKTSSSGTEDDEKLIVFLLANENQMEFWIIENKIRINGKKWDKAMKNLSLE
jgi:lysyl-tRNA synthetase class 2